MFVVLDVSYNIRRKTVPQSMSVTTEKHYRESSVQTFDVSHTFLVCNHDKMVLNMKMGNGKLARIEN